MVVLGLLWTGWTVWSTAHALSQAERHAEIMRASLIRGDADTAREALADYRAAAGTAESRTGGVTWDVLGVLPVLGDDASGIEVVAGVLADLGRDGLPPLADAAEQVSGEAFRPQGHRFPLTAIADLEAPAERSEAAFTAAVDELAAVDADAFAGPIENRFVELRDLVDTARGTLDSTYRAARLMPRLLGADRPRNLLLVLQNNAELRSSGGLPGALTLVRADAGKVEVVEQSDAADLGNSAKPILPLTAEERRIFGDLLGRFPVDATLTPDFPRAAELLRTRWERARGGRVDGVVFVDPVAVSYLMAGTGPVAVPGYPELTAGTVVGAVENQVYRLSDDRRVHSDYQQKVAKAVFDALADGTGDSVQTVTGLVRGVQEGRIRMHLSEKWGRDEVAGTAIAGEFVRDGAGAGEDPQVGIYLNDAGPTKMQYYLKYDAHVVSRSCVDGVQVIAGSIDLHADTPPDAEDLPDSITGAGYPGVRVEPGHQLLVLYVTSPVAGTIESLSLNEQRVAAPVVEPLAGRQVARVGVELAPGERGSVDFVVRSGPGQEGPVDLAVTPGAAPVTSNATVPSACRIR